MTIPPPYVWAPLIVSHYNQLYPLPRVVAAEPGRRPFETYTECSRSLWSIVLRQDLLDHAYNAGMSIFLIVTTILPAFRRQIRKKLSRSVNTLSYIISHCMRHEGSPESGCTSTFSNLNSHLATFPNWTLE